MIRQKTVYSWTLFLVTLASALILYSNCLRVVGTGNPPTVKPNSPVARLASTACERLESCGHKIESCEKFFLTNALIATAAQINTSQTTDLLAFDQKEQANQVFVDEKSLNSCLSEISASACSEVVADLKDPFKSVASFLSARSACTRFTLDKFKLKKVVFPSSYTSFVHSVAQHQGRSYFAVADGPEIKIFDLKSKTEQPLTHIFSTGNFIRLFWHKEETQICGYSVSPGFIRCFEFLDQNPKEVLQISISPSSGLNYNPEEFVSVKTSTSEHTIFFRNPQWRIYYVNNESDLKFIELPQNSDNKQFLGNSVNAWVYVMRLGWLRLNNLDLSQSKIDPSAFFGSEIGPTQSVGGLIWSKGDTGNDLGQVVISDPAAKTLHLNQLFSDSILPIQSLSTPIGAETLGHIQISDSIEGYLIHSRSTAETMIVFRKNRNKFAEPIPIDPLRIEVLHTLDFNGDGRSDIISDRGSGTQIEVWLSE